MRALRNIWILGNRELFGYFASPIAYVFLVIFLVLSGVFTFALGAFWERGVASLDPFFRWHPFIYMVFVPAVGMRLWAEEIRAGTVELLFTWPVAAWHAVLAKFLAGAVFLAVALLLTAPMVWTVNFLGDPDNGVIASGYLGSFLMALAFFGLSSFTSSLTRNQIVSFIVSVVLSLLLVLAGLPQVLDPLSGWGVPDRIVEVIKSFSIITHYSTLMTGLIDSRDLIYFLSIIGFGLFGTFVVLRSK